MTPDRNGGGGLAHELHARLARPDLFAAADDLAEAHMRLNPPPLPPGIEHGTPEGHTHGCHGEQYDCPALYEHGMSCTYAKVRADTDVRYYKAKTRDPRPAAIARTLGFTPQHRPTLENLMPNPRSKKHKTPTPEPSTPTPPPTTTVTDVDERPRLALADFTRGLTQSQTTTRGREIRDWLRNNGHPTLSNKGVIPSNLLHQYLDAHPYATGPARPLAEQPHDPSDTTPPPADEVTAATPEKAPAEGEGMGHHTATPEDLDAWAEDRPEHTPATAELIDQIRDRIDMPIPEARLAATPTPHPEWADVTISEDVTRALAERDQALAERDRAQQLAITLDNAHNTALTRAETAETALELTLTHWAHEKDTSARRLARIRRLVFQLITEREQTRGAERRAKIAERATDELLAQLEASPGGMTASLITDGTRTGIRLTPTRRPFWRRTPR